MKYKFSVQAPAGHGNTHHFIAMNIREIELLRGMALKLKEDLPKTGPTKRLHDVSQNMCRALAEAMTEAEKVDKDLSRLKVYPFDDKSVV